MLRGSTISVKVLLEGREVDVSAVNVTHMMGGGSKASVSIPITAEAFKLKPKTYVEIYFKDTSVSEDWWLLFDGEVIATPAQITPGSAHISLECESLLPSSLRDAEVWFKHWSIFHHPTKKEVERVAQAKAGKGPKSLQKSVQSYAGLSAQDTAFVLYAKGSKQVSISPVLDSGQQRIFSKLRSKSKTFPEITGFLGGIYRLLEDLFGLGDDNKYKGWFGAVNEHYRLLHRIGGATHDKTTTKLYSTAAFWSWLKSAVNSLDPLTNFLAVLNVILARTHFIMISKPPHYHKDEEHNREFLYEMLLVPLAPSMSPPLTNVIFPDQYETIIYNRNYLAEPTRLLVAKPNQFMGMRDTFLFGNKTYVFPNSTVYNKDKHVKDNQILPNELYTGPNIQMMEMNDTYYWDWLLGQSDKSVIKDMHKTHRKVYEKHNMLTNKDYVAQYTDYMFFLRKFQPRQGMIKMRFTPYIVPGFSALVLFDAKEYPLSHMRMLPVRVTHSITIHGAETVVEYQFARFDNEEFEEMGDNVAENFFDPPWLAADYTAPKIGNMYERVIGCRSAWDYEEELTHSEGPYRHQRTASELYLDYLPAKEWYKDLIRRTMVPLTKMYPEDQLYPLMLRPVTHKKFDFVTGRQKAVDAYIKSLEYYSTRAFEMASNKQLQESGTNEENTKKTS